MAEDVTMVEAEVLDVRLAELVNRLGRSRDLDALRVFELLCAARARGPGVARVIRHVCRHDEGIGDCTDAPRVEG